MLCIISKSNFAPFNIATEEFILKNLDQDVFLLYRNTPSIIVGKHQNTLSEINYDYVRQHAIPVVRRMTGGGTVFHDMGNLNFCFIMQEISNDARSFEKYTLPVISALKSLGIDARLEGRNDLTINGLKFSGNARGVFGGKVLQHGTILYSSQMADLSSALQFNPLKFKDKAVKSIRARVTNVCDHLSEPLELDAFIALIHNEVRSLFADAVDHEFSSKELDAIQELVDSKYDTWEWNYGSSPKFNHRGAIRCTAGTIEIYTEIEKGRIADIRVFGDFFGTRDPSEFEDALKGTLHREDEVIKVLETMPLDEIFGLVTPLELSKALF
ncbi:MAG: lipoate--protein ligase [Candidatus Cloacimonadaceae bacterium]|nr:lipoate--protein ligase [Candidatus Cloacimonadaceae bacterium]